MSEGIDLKKRREIAALGLCARMIDILDREVELVFAGPNGSRWRLVRRAGGRGPAALAKTHRLRATGDPDVKTHRWVLQQTSFLWNWKTRLASGDVCRQDFSLVYLLTKPRRSRSRP